MAFSKRDDPAGILEKGAGARFLTGFDWPSPGCSLCCTVPTSAGVMQPGQGLVAAGGK